MERVRAWLATVMVGLVVGSGTAVGQQRHDREVVPVAVTNFPETVRVEGRVALEGPLDGTRLVSLADLVVAPTRREDTTRLVEAGSLDTRGFAAAVVSLLVETKAPLQRLGEVGAVLLPDDELVLRALAEKGLFLLAEEVKVIPPAPSMPYLAAAPVRFTVAYPRYRVFLYNGTDKTVSVTVHAYLTN